jgi:hypothetical protein
MPSSGSEDAQTKKERMAEQKEIARAARAREKRAAAKVPVFMSSFAES